MGRSGERAAEAFLQRRGGTIVARNRRVDRGEIDLLVRWGDRLVAVEVKTRAAADPAEEFTEEQARALRRAGSLLGVDRCDLVTVRAGPEGLAIRWIPGVC